MAAGAVSHPRVLTEEQTLDMALAGTSLARFGDGELRLCLDGVSRSQKPSMKIQKELRALLAEPSKALVCIPNVKTGTPRWKNWWPYMQPQYTRLYRLPLYGSAFISRPDSAPWINNGVYWHKIRSLWLDKDVTLVWQDT